MRVFPRQLFAYVVIFQLYLESMFSNISLKDCATTLE